jgi:hypothetical protein
MTGLELVVGYLAAWGVRKVQRVGKRLDEDFDEATDSALDRLHDIVVAKLDGDPAVTKLGDEAARDGAVSPRTRQRVELSLEDAMENDTDFRDRLSAVLAELEDLSHGAGNLAGIDLRGARGVQVGNHNEQTNTFN